jgi:hypothetical protein
MPIGLAPVAVLFALLAPSQAPPPPAADQVPILSSHGSAVAASPPAGGAAAASHLAFTLPPAWTSQTPSSGMRLSQAMIPGSPGSPGSPGAAGAAGPGQFAVFFFGPGGGGTAEANIQRWIEQIDKPLAAPRGETFTVNGLKVRWIEVAGTLKAETIGMGPSTPQPGSRLLGAVVEGPGGPWYFKAIGPDATIAAARGGFLAMLHGLRPQ